MLALYAFDILMILAINVLQNTSKCTNGVIESSIIIYDILFSFLKIDTGQIFSYH